MFYELSVTASVYVRISYLLLGSHLVLWLLFDGSVRVLKVEVSI